MATVERTKLMTQRRGWIFCAVSFILFGLMFAVDAEAAAAAVKVKKAPVTVNYRTYVFGHPPPDMPQLDTPLGVCHAEFREQARCLAEYPRFGTKGSIATITSVEISLELHITIWLSEGSSAGVQAHEEAHRQIAEYYYRSADTIARRVGNNAVGKKLVIPAKNKTSALQEALRKVGTGIVDEIHRDVYERCKYAEERFDVITDHGRNKIGIEEAMARALKEEELQRAVLRKQ